MHSQMFERPRLVLLAGALAIGVPAAGQQEVAAVDAAVAEYARARVGVGKRVGFDPDLTSGHEPAPESSKAAGGELTDVRATRIARALQGPVVRTKDVYGCAGGPSTCHLRDVDAVVRWLRPEVSGDSASVFLVVLRSTGLSRVPVQRITQHVVFVRSGGEWKPSRVVRRSSS